MLTTYVVDSSHMKSFPGLWLFLLFHAHHHTGRVPLRHDTAECNRSVTPDSLLWFCVLFSQENKFHNLLRAGSIHLTHRAVLETSRHCADLLQRQNLDHLAHHCVFRPIDRVVAQFGPGLQHQVTWSPFFFKKNPVLLVSLPDPCIPLHNASVVFSQSALSSVKLYEYDDSMTALVSENTIDSRPVRSRCACTELTLCIVQLSCVCLWTS